MPKTYYMLLDHACQIRSFLIFMSNLHIHILMGITGSLNLLIGNVFVPIHKLTLQPEYIHTLLQEIQSQKQWYLF